MAVTAWSATPYWAFGVAATGNRILSRGFLPSATRKDAPGREAPPRIIHHIILI